MKKFTPGLLSLGLLFGATQVAAQAEAPLLMQLQKDIFAEMLRFNGEQMKTATVLQWCGNPELASEFALPPDARKRELFQAFVVAGTQNVAATEIARKMPDDRWDLFSHAMNSDLDRYLEGLNQGLTLAFSTPNAKTQFCQQQEQHAIESARVIKSVRQE